MRKLYSLRIAILLILALAGCGGGGSTTVVMAPNILEVLSDPTVDGDIKMDIATGVIGPPTTAVNTGGVFAGIEVNPTGAPISEYRGFLIFPLGRLPAKASIQFASISIFLNNVVFGTTSTAPVPFLLDSIDTVLFPPPIESGDFNAAFRMSRSVSFFGTDTGTFVEINVTNLLADAQRALLPDFEVRVLFDQVGFTNDPTATRGLIEIDDRATNTSRAPLLYVEYF
jgi:hypothetical protein